MSKPAKPFDFTKFKGRTLTFQPKRTIYTHGDLALDVFFIKRGKVKITVKSVRGKEATIGIMEPGMFFGEQVLAGTSMRLVTAIALTEVVAVAIPKEQIQRAIKTDQVFSDMFMKYLLKRTKRIQEDLVDQLFNSSERRLARTLLLLSHYGQEIGTQPIPKTVTHETLAEIVGTTRPKVAAFMSKFRQLGFIQYDGAIEVRASLLNAVLHEKPQIGD